MIGVVEMNKDKDIKESLNSATLLDAIFFIPLCFLFYYLPSDHWWQILLNLVIIILCTIGITRIFYWFKNKA